jgi:hypothetical protein
MGDNYTGNPLHSLMQQTKKTYYSWCGSFLWGIGCGVGFFGAWGIYAFVAFILRIFWEHHLKAVAAAPPRA